MTDAFGGRPFPRGVLIAIASLLSFVIIAIGIARLTGAKLPQAPLTPEVQSREISFRDLPNGSLAVHDAETGGLIHTLPPGDEGFIRGVLRSLARQRGGHGADITEPFHLARRENGHLTLEDPATGILIDLKAFGPSNQAAFEPFLPALPTSP